MTYYDESLRHFQVEDDPMNPGSFRVVMYLACYEANFGIEAYPEQLRGYAYGGGPTSFTIIARSPLDAHCYEGMGRDEAQAVADELERDYADRIRSCEHNAAWESWPPIPFDAGDVIFYR